MSLTEVLDSHGLGRLARFAWVLAVFVLLAALRAPLVAMARGLEIAMAGLDGLVADRLDRPADADSASPSPAAYAAGAGGSL